jgi:1,4-dihydroxy-2-naphthoate octaprenyltransferase
LHFAPVVIVVGLALLAALEFAFQKFRLKYHGWAEIIAFALTGPLLTSGFAWAIADRVTLGAAALGCVFGSITLMYFHASNFENIMPDSQAGVRTWATRSGFDSSQRFFHFTAVLTMLCSLAFVVGFQQDVKLAPLLFAQAMFLVPMVLRVKGLTSPLSSGLAGLRNEAVSLCWITSVALVGGFAWILRS